MSAPAWTNAPTYPNGNAPEDAFMDPPGTQYPWCYLAGAVKTQGSWSRDAKCYVVKPNVKPEEIWKTGNYFEINDKKTCQKYMIDANKPLPAYQGVGKYETVKYTAVEDGTTYWPQVEFKDKPDQCASVLSISAWQSN